MFGVFLLVGTVALLVAIAAQPKLGSLLVFPVLFLYPHLYMLQLDLLPWNIGVDDLFVCVFFFIVFVRRNLFEGVPIRWGLSLWGAASYFLIWAMANLSGWSLMPELGPQDIVKPILKYAVNVLYVYSLVHTIDDTRDVKRVAVVFVVCMALAGVTVVLQQFFPRQMSIFAAGATADPRSLGTTPERPVGSLTSANTGCVILGMSAVLGLALIQAQRTLQLKAGLWICVLIQLVGMLYVKSRTGIFALGITMAVMAVFSRLRLRVWGLLGCIAAGALFLPGLFFEFMERVTETYNPVAGVLDPNTQTRIEIWKSYWENASTQVWMFGQGRIVPTLQLGFHPHNSYVGALFLHGIGGVVWLFVLFGLLGRRAWWLSRNAADPLRSVASGVGWGTMVWAIAGLTQDMIVTPLPRFVYLLFIVLIDRGYAIAPRPPFVEAPAPFMRPGAFRAIQAAERHGRPERVGT